MTGYMSVITADLEKEYFPTDDLSIFERMMGDQPDVVVPTLAPPPDFYERKLTVHDLWDLYMETGDQGKWMRQWKEENAVNMHRGLRRIKKITEEGMAMFIGVVHMTKIDGRTGEMIDFGMVSPAVVTDVGCQKIVAVMNTSDATTATNFKFHGIGTGTTAEAASDTTLVTELTTEYNPNSTRATGSQTTGATTKVLRTVGTNTLDSGTPAVTEHGDFSASSGGSLLDRSVFSAINLVGANADALQTTYDLTTVSGG